MHFFRHTWDLLARIALAGASFFQAQWADASLRVLLALMLLDYLSALLTAWKCKSPKSGGGLDSKAGIKGIVRKVLILFTVTASGFMDALLVNETPMLRQAVTVFYAVNEALSLLENLALCDVPIPNRLKQALEVLKKGDGKQS